MVEIAGSGYKDKYLQALDDQERQEKQLNFQLDLMRRTLTYLGSAAHGLDKKLDAELLLLKEKMRGAAGVQVVEQLERVKQAVMAFERNREHEHQATVEKMRALLLGYLALKLPAELSDKVRAFSGNLQQAISSYRHYPRVLGELTLLQKSALQAAMNPAESFFERLKGGRTLSAREGPVEDKQVPASKRQHQPDAPIEPENLQLDARDQAVEHSVAPSLHTSRHVGNKLNEDDYDAVAARIAMTLRELVENIEPNDIIRHRVDMVSARIERGMDWFSLSVTLEDIRDILMQRYLDVDREFSQYLQDVNKELLTISDTLSTALEREARANSHATELSEAVNSEMQKIQTSMTASTSLDNMKISVNSHLSIIQAALQDYRAVQQQDTDSVTNELKKLLSKVEAIEVESSKTKELLEEERYKATHDTLTGLPNREAYNERAFHELQRFKRYERPLTMAVCDIDFFKKINDNYGHQSGDKVIKLIAKLIFTRLREVDFAGRYGGEEFVLLMPETSPESAHIVLEKIRKTIAKAAFRFKENPVSITISFGLAGFEKEDTVESVFERADKALYQAKEQGRNRCIIYDPSMASA